MDRDSVFINAFAVPTLEFDPNFQALMKDDVIEQVSNIITDRLLKVFPDKPYKVTRKCILQALEYAYINKYVYNFNIFDCINTVANSFIQQIIDERYQIEQNDKLDTWIVKYDGTKGIRRHATVKLNEKGMSVPVSFMGRY